MKYLNLVFLTLTLTACSKNYDIGDCVQLPDSGAIYEIISKDEAEGSYSMVQKQDGHVVETKVETSVRNYVKTECPSSAPTVKGN